MSFAPLLSSSQSLILSPGQARSRGINSLFSMVSVYYNFLGYGPFSSSNSSLSIPSGTGSDQAFWSYDSAWPFLYNRITETWTEGSNSQVTVTSYTPNQDEGFFEQTSTLIGTVHGSVGQISITVTPTLITVSYHYTGSSSPGTYTAKLSGTTVDNTAAGPFNPATDWTALVNTIETLLASIAIPARPGGYVFGGVFYNSSLWSYITFQKAAPGYQVNTLNYSNFPTTIQLPAYAAASGCPVAGSPLSVAGFLCPNISDNGGYTGLTMIPNAGVVFSTKSQWVFQGATWWNKSDTANAQTPRVNATCRSLFCQKIDPTTLVAGGSTISTGVISRATTLVNPIALPSTVNFGPTDVINELGTYGMIGFQGTAA